MCEEITVISFDRDFTGEIIDNVATVTEMVLVDEYLECEVLSTAKQWIEVLTFVD